MSYLFLFFLFTGLLAIPIKAGIGYNSKDDRLIIEFGVFDFLYRKQLTQFRTKLLMILGEKPNPTEENTQEQKSDSQTITNQEKREKKFSIERIWNKYFYLSKASAMKNGLWLFRRSISPLQVDTATIELEYGCSDAQQVGILTGGIYTLLGLFRIYNHSRTNISINPYFVQHPVKVNLHCIICSPLGHIISIFFYVLIAFFKSIKRRGK